jgi:hypothetical protein
MAKDNTTPNDPPAPRGSNPVTSTAARAHLECTHGPEKGQTFRVAPGQTVIGRDESCEVILSETVVSRQHCRIERRPDGWVIVNLSSNGTRLNRKEVEESPLADGDEIRMGAKTRLRFVVEEVAAVVSGRPQFRARMVGGPAETPAEEGAGEAEEKPSLFKRRKGLFIGLSIYLLAMIIFAVIMLLKDPIDRTSSRVPVLMEDDMIQVAGKPPMRIVRQTPEGPVVEDVMGTLITVPLADLQSGKAKRLPGIRKAIDVQFLEQDKAPTRDYPYTIAARNPGVADQYVKEAIALYQVADLPGKDSALFECVRRFQKALAHYGRGFLPDVEADRIRQEAVKRLIERVSSAYTTALTLEGAGELKGAWRAYKSIHDMVPEVNNPIFENVSRRMDDVSSKAAAQKQK